MGDGTRKFCFMAGAQSRKLDALLNCHGQNRWAFITAWNPASVELGDAENGARQRELLRYVEAAGFTSVPGRGVGEDPAWKPEESLLILGMDHVAAVDTGRRFGQLAVVVGKLGSPACLVSCSKFAT